MTTTYAPTTRLATDRQLSLIEKLCAEQNEAYDRSEAELLSTSEASALISAMIANGKAANPAPVAALPSFPAGSYALTVDGIVKFYRIDRPMTGKWAGYTFVKIQASDDFYPVRGAAAKAITDAIAVDPQAAAQLYGQTIGRCSLCSRTLTDPESIAFGVGPVCREGAGW